MQILEVYLLPIDNQHFSAIATLSQVGDGAAESRIPFWDGKCDRFSTLIKTLELSSGFSTAAFPEAEEQFWMEANEWLSADREGFHPNYLKTIGSALYQALFPAGSRLRACLETALRLAEQSGEVLHLRLKLAANSVERSCLADYPWELIHDGQRFLLQHRVAVSRYIAYEALPPNISKAAQIKVLLISSGAADAHFGLYKLPKDEQQSVCEGLSKAQDDGAVTLDQIAKPTLNAVSIYLSECAETPQVIHFDGHGLYGKRCSNPECLKIHPGIKAMHCSHCRQLLPLPEGFLLFEDEHGGPDYVSAVDFGMRLPNGVVLVVLSACQSGMAVSGQSLFAGVAQQLIDARVPAVVAMQYAVRVDAASQFAEQFYRALSKRKSLMVAVQEGRRSMRPGSNQWYRPVLYLRWQDNEGGQLFTEEETEQLMSGLSRFDRLQRGRWTEELRDWDQHYVSAQAQLRIETNPVTRNRLKYQIEQIGAEMDECERLLSQLEAEGGE